MTDAPLLPPHELVLGAELKPGDTIVPWYTKTATIKQLREYTGPLAHLWPSGARIASFTWDSEFRARGMTIDNAELYVRLLP